MPPSTATYVRRSLLDRDHTVERHAGGPGDGPSGFDGQPRRRQADARAVPLDGRGQRAEPGGSQAGLPVRVGDGVTAAEVELGQRHPVRVADPRELVHQDTRALLVRPDRGDLGSQMAVQADQLKACLVEDPVHRLPRPTGRDRQPKLVVLAAGADGGVRPGFDVGNHPHQHLLPHPHGDERGETVDLGEIVDDDAADPLLHGRAQVRGGLGVAVEDDPVRGKPAARATASSPAEHTSSASPSYRIQEAMARHQKAFAAYATSARGSAAR